MTRRGNENSWVAAPEVPHLAPRSSLARLARADVGSPVKEMDGLVTDGLVTSPGHDFDTTEVKVQRNAQASTSARMPVKTRAGFVTGPDDGFDTAEDGTKLTASGSDFTITPADQATSPNSPPNTEGHPENHARDPHTWVGLSLITGFILMYLIDTLPRQAVRAAPPRRFSISLNAFSLSRTNTRNTSPNDPSTTHEPPTPTFGQFSDSHKSTARPASTTLGLVIHAAADGIALGASSTTTARLTFIIFLALLIHKAPAAFGLTSVLLKQGLSKRAARFHLLIFSLAAPAGALVTWSAAHLLGYAEAADGSKNGDKQFAVGVLLLFSAGTFLYVAMHTMQSAADPHHGAPDDANNDEGFHPNGYAHVGVDDIYTSQSRAPQERQGSTGGVLETAVTVAGMILPLLTVWGHAGH